MEQTATYGPPSGFESAVAAIRYMREHDCDFLTIENVRDYSGANSEQATAALRQEMGDEWTDELVAAPRSREWRVTFTDAAGGLQTVAFRGATQRFVESEARRTFGNIMIESAYAAGPPARLLADDLAACGWDVIPGQVAVQFDNRLFAVSPPGRRWTRIPEYLSNGQLTARWFVDESTGEVRMAESARRPQGWAMTGERAEFVLAILKMAREG